MSFTPFQPFAHKDFGILHVLKDSGEVWFLASDIAREFHILNTNRMLETYIPDDCIMQSTEISSTDYGPLINLEGVHLLDEFHPDCSDPKFIQWIDKWVVPNIKDIDEIPWYDREIYVSKGGRFLAGVLDEALTFSASVVLGTSALQAIF